MFPRKSVAVIGGGVAGISAAYYLSQNHNVTMFEKNNYLGGHTFTVPVREETGNELNIDMGFIVLNDQTYPLLHTFLSELEVAVQWSNMSFAFYSEISDFLYSGTGFSGLLARKRNLISAKFWRLLRDVKKFSTLASLDLKNEKITSISLGEYVERNKFSKAFVDYYLLPIGASIWSTPVDGMLDFPAETLISFFRNHGLLSLKNRPRWQTVIGGSSTYIKKFQEIFSGTINLNCGKIKISRLSEKISLQNEQASLGEFDEVVIATHADQPLSLFVEPSNLETELLSLWTYEQNEVILHTDLDLLPRNKNAWASWNYLETGNSLDQKKLIATYHMNRLQNLASKTQYFVSLNAGTRINPAKIIKKMSWAHPHYTSKTLATQSRLSELQGNNHTWYCGSYFGYGFHEDALRSGVQVASLINNKYA